MSAVAELCGVHKRFGEHEALRGLALEVAEGEVVALLGPNGAGKTTAIELLLGLLRPDRGRVLVAGRDALGLPWPLRQRIGFLGERADRSLPDLTLPALLSWQSCYFATWDHAWCEQLVRRLDAVTDQRIDRMSEGQRRRAETVLALAHRPELLVLDDPAAGLDPLARRDLLWATIDAVRDEGTTVLFTSHVLQDVERIVDDVCIVDRGRARLHGALDDVLLRSKRLVLPADAAPPPPLPGEVRRERRGRELAIVTTAFDDDVHARLGGGARVDALNLEEIFCSLLTESPADDGGGRP